jgi:hypothetical protein
VLSANTGEADSGNCSGFANPSLMRRWRGARSRTLGLLAKCVSTAVTKGRVALCAIPPLMQSVYLAAHEQFCSMAVTVLHPQGDATSCLEG